MDGRKMLIKLKISGTEKLIAGQVNGTHDLKVDVFETTNKLSTNGAKTYMAGQHTITYKVDCAVDPNDLSNATYSDVYAAIKAKAEVDYVWGGVVAGEKKYRGKAIITGLSQAAQMGNAVTFSIDLQVTGDEVEETVV